MYVEPDSFDAEPLLRQTRDAALAHFAKHLSIEVEMPTEEPAEVVWTDHDGKRNAFHLGVFTPNYLGRRAWSLCINAGRKIQRELIDRSLTDAPLKARELASGGSVPEHARDWSLWKVVITVDQAEIIEFTEWMALLAHARLSGGSIPTPPEGLGQQDIGGIFGTRLGDHQYSSSQGHFALLKEMP